MLMAISVLVEKMFMVYCEMTKGKILYIISLFQKICIYRKRENAYMS